MTSANGEPAVRHRIRRVSVAVLIVMVAITAGGAWAAKTAVKDQEAKLLQERTNEIGLVLTADLAALPGPLDVLGGVLKATHNSAAAFRQASAAADVGSAQGVTFALLARRPAGFTVLMAEGGGLHQGELITDRRSEAFQRALATTQLVPTAVIGAGATRALGYALGPPVAPAGTVLYREDPLGPVHAPRQAATAPFSELNVVIYGSPHPERSQVLAETNAALPLKGPIRTQPLPAGAATWTLQASAVHPLVGGTVEDAPWIVLVGGIAVSLLVAFVIEAETRRRKSAIALYDTEHGVAETLQRSLLPKLPVIAGLGLAARYLAGAAHQEVGGDWFDVFDLGDGRVGVVIGDVVGHDIAAAAAMSKVQASLRAYAWSGDQPSEVLDRLDGLITTFEITELVTVFYGVLEPADDAGDRRLTFANAGHLPPYIRQPGGAVDDLHGVSSLLLGAPRPAGAVRSQAEVTLRAGAVLVLFTDGLVEVPGESLTRSLDQLKDTLTAAPLGIDSEALCDLVVAQIHSDQLRDDVAVLTVALAVTQAPAPRTEAPMSTSAATAWTS
jgi:Stage II sporulation protein E (SpoIIE)